MFGRVELLLFAGFHEHAVVDLPSFAGDIPPEHRVPHPEKDLVHPERVVLGSLLGRGKGYSGESLDCIPLEEDAVGLDPVIKPALDPQVVHELGLDLVNRAVILPGEGTIAPFHRAAFDDAGTWRDVDDGAGECCLATAHRDI